MGEEEPSFDVYVDAWAYDPGKNFYLNGELLRCTPDVDLYSNADYSFTDVTCFKVTNANGKADPAKVNVLEYR